MIQIVIRCMVLCLLNAGCAGMYMDDWQLHYNNCKLHEHDDAAAVTCKWRHTWLGT
jgi:hypothetical protein